MATIINREFWKEFIILYQELPELWQNKHEKYKNRIAKEEAWEKLTNKFKEVEPCATIELVKKKINGMRTCFRREYVRVKKSEMYATTPEEIHIPTLWYYNDLKFLTDQEQEAQLEGEPPIDLIETEDDSLFEAETLNIHSNKKKKLDLDNQKKDCFQKSNEKRRDEADIFSESWAVLFRKLSHEQKIYAKKSIDDIFYFGQLGKLTFNNSLQNNVNGSASTVSPSQLYYMLPSNSQSVPLYLNGNRLNSTLQDSAFSSSSDFSSSPLIQSTSNNQQPIVQTSTTTTIKQESQNDIHIGIVNDTMHTSNNK